MTTYTFNLAASARVYASEEREFDTLEQALAHARSIDFGDFNLLLDDESCDLEGDEIVYVRPDDGSEHIIEVADEGEPYAWIAADIVKKLAKADPADATTLAALIADARKACTRAEDAPVKQPDALALDEESEANADASYAVDMEA